MGTSQEVDIFDMVEISGGVEIFTQSARPGKIMVFDSESRRSVIAGIPQGFGRVPVVFPIEWRTSKSCFPDLAACRNELKSACGALNLDR